MSLKSGWLVSALMLAGLAGASRADEPTSSVVAPAPAASYPAPGAPLQEADAPCCDAPGQFGSWLWGWKTECGAQNGLHPKHGCGFCKARVPCLPEAYGYHETCWRPWTFPRQCPRCLAPQIGLAACQPSAPTVELAAPVAGTSVPDDALPAPKKESNASPYR